MYEAISGLYEQKSPLQVMRNLILLLNKFVKLEEEKNLYIYIYIYMHYLNKEVVKA